MKFKGTPKKLKSQISIPIKSGSNLKSKSQSLKITLKSAKESKILKQVPGQARKEKPVKHSPKINRFITERIKKFYRVRWALSATIICAAMFLVIAFLIFLQLQNIKALKAQRGVLQANLRAWQAILRRYPDYRDGYLQAAVLEYRLNNIEAARRDVEKAQLLDSTYEPTKQFLSILNGR